MKNLLFLILLSIVAACSPLRTSPNDERHQWELKFHEMQTNLDDLKHDIHCFQTEIQILDGRIKYYENALATLKQQDLEKQTAKLEQLGKDLRQLEKKWTAFEKTQEDTNSGVLRLTSHANETSTALIQFKSRIQELEQQTVSQNRRFEELAKVKNNLETITKSLASSKTHPYKVYKVRPGDSLEKIANMHHTKADRIKKFNELESDLIVVDQELKIPND